MITNMTQKRQVTIAKDICDEEGLAPGKPVRVQRLVGGGVGLFPAPAVPENIEARRAEIRARLRAFAGSLTAHDCYPGMSTDAYMQMIRGEDLP
jgi:hypothetical protein